MLSRRINTNMYRHSFLLLLHISELTCLLFINWNWISQMCWIPITLWWAITVIVPEYRRKQRRYSDKTRFQTWKEKRIHFFKTPSRLSQRPSIKLLCSLYKKTNHWQRISVFPVISPFLPPNNKSSQIYVSWQVNLTAITQFDAVCNQSSPWRLLFHTSSIEHSVGVVYN